jgi:hypothetical protein
MVNTVISARFHLSVVAIDIMSFLQKKMVDDLFVVFKYAETSRSVVPTARKLVFYLNDFSGRLVAPHRGVKLPMN